MRSLRLIAMFTLLGGQQASAEAPALPPPYAGAYQPKGVDEIGLWREQDESERQLAASSLVIHDEKLTDYVKQVLCETVGQDRCGSVRVYIMREPTFNATMASNGKLRKQGETVAVAGSSIAVTPTRDWNSLNKTIGKNTETWTTDGEQLNDVTFFGGIAAGNPLVKEKSKKRDPLPKFTKTTLLVEIPELLEGTYRTYKNSGSFRVLSTDPGSFLGRDGVHFTYTFTDEDELTRLGEARAAIIDGKLYMITFEAPRLSYFDKAVGAFRALANTARLK